ncbi:MAG: hypothetical protein ABI298_05675 [Acidimicrobiales bacterium]
MSTTLDLPRVTLAESWDEFDIDERFGFATLLEFGDASIVSDDVIGVGY